MASVTHTEFMGDLMTHRRVRITVAANETTPWYLVSQNGGMVAVKPTSGTMRAELTGSPLSVVTADNANATSNAIAFTWPPSDASAAAQADFTFTTAIRFVAIGAGGIAEISE